MIFPEYFILKSYRAISTSKTDWIAHQSQRKHVELTINSQSPTTIYVSFLHLDRKYYSISQRILEVISQSCVMQL
jgi:hypothetical protein